MTEIESTRRPSGRSPVLATVFVRNDTRETKSIRPGHTVRCALGVQPMLRNSEGNFSGYDDRQSSCLQTHAMAAGETASFDATVSTTSLELPSGRRNARYDLVLEYFPTAPQRIASSSQPIAIHVVAPD